MAAAAEIVAALVAPWEAAAAVLGVAALARTVVSLEANGAAVLKVVQPGARGAAVALVVKVVATAATAARAAEAATAVGMAGKMASRTPCNDRRCTTGTRMELLCTGRWDPRYKTRHDRQHCSAHCIRSSQMGSRAMRTPTGIGPRGPGRQPPCNWLPTGSECLHHRRWPNWRLWRTVESADALGVGVKVVPAAGAAA